MNFAYFPCSTDLLQSLLFPQPVKIIPARHGTRKLIAVLKTANHLCRTWDKLITLKPSDTLSRSFYIVLPSARRSSKWSTSLGFPKQNYICISRLLVCATRFPPLIILQFINTNNAESRKKFMKFLIKRIFSASCHFLRIGSKYLPHHPFHE